MGPPMISFNIAESNSQLIKGACYFIFKIYEILLVGEFFLLGIMFFFPGIDLHLRKSVKNETRYSIHHVSTTQTGSTGTLPTTQVMTRQVQ